MDPFITKWLLSLIVGTTFVAAFASFPTLTTSTVALFAILSHALFPLFGAILGTILAYLGLLTISLPLYFLIIDKLKD